MDILGAHGPGKEAVRAKLIVPPFGGIDRPSIGCHLLQACARGVRSATVSVDYANIDFAQHLGIQAYNSICYGPTTGLAGERVFSSLAFALPQLGLMHSDDEAYFRRQNTEGQTKVSYESLRVAADLAEEWIDRYVVRVLQGGVDIVGCSTTFEQTCASLAILQRVKKYSPDTVTILGGANCEGDMAEGLCGISGFVDYIFSGESEETFPELLAAISKGDTPRGKVIRGTPCLDLDALPPPKYTEFYEQMESQLPTSRFPDRPELWLPYETSRGCWWGQVHHCTFCGINGQSMAFRKKTAGRVIEDLKGQLSEHPVKNICMVDNIMPMEYFNELMPRLGDAFDGLNIFYEQKANLKLRQVQALARGGVGVIQPGIEALSSEFLRHMKKGVTTTQNIALLRYCRSVGISVNWNLLYAFPGDQIEWFETTHGLFPYIVHLMPPSGVYHLSIDRFSPYFNSPADFGIRRIEPMAAYSDVFPLHADIERIAYHFVGDYDSGSRSRRDVVDKITEGVGIWRKRWTEGVAPKLELTEVTDGIFLLVDSRSAEQRETLSFVDRQQAVMAIAGVGGNGARKWARQRNIVIEVDGKDTPLATCTPDLFEELMGR